MNPWFDDRHDPLHVQVFPESYVYADLDAALTRFEEYYIARRKREASLRIVLVHDLSRLRRSDARNRKRITETYARLNDLMREHTVGQALVLPRTVLRHAMTAVFWIKRPPWPVKVFAKQEGALDWLRELLAAEGVVMPTPVPWWLTQDRSDFENLDDEAPS